jgi:hypothetical protein
VTQRDERVMAAIYVAVVIAYLAVLAWVAVPGVRDNVRRGRDWARFYAWRARWNSLPSWAQEALEVRGMGPVQ